MFQMARMVATKAALSIRVDALTDADGKSEDQAPSIGIENRAKLESRLRALENQGDLAGARRFADGGKKQQRFEMSGDTKTYNTTADAVDLMPTQRDPMELAVKAVLDVKQEKKSSKEERRAKRRAEKTAIKETTADLEMDVDGDDDSNEKLSKEKKRKRRESGENDAAGAKVCLVYLSLALANEHQQEETPKETKAERKARKKARKAEKAAAAGEEIPKKKKRKADT